MKKILLAVAAVIVSMTAGAQGIEIYKGSTLEASYTGSDYKAVMTKTPTAVAPAGGHDYVEITYNSKTLKWATMNVGATTVASSEETSYGNYYQWANTNQWVSSVTYPASWGTKVTPTFITGKSDGYATSTDPNYINSAYSNLVSPTVTSAMVALTYDVAHAAWGGSWRMPSADDFNALAGACGGALIAQPTAFTGSTITAKGIYWISPTKGGSVTIDGVVYKVPGLLFVADDTDTSKRVFFPAAGYIRGKSLYAEGTFGYYWSSSLSNTKSASSLYFFIDFVNTQSGQNREYGLPVRPVSE